MKFYKIRGYYKFKGEKDYTLMLVDTYFDIGKDNDIELYLESELGIKEGNTKESSVSIKCEEYFKDGIKRVILNDNEDRYFYVNFFVDYPNKRDMYLGC